ncbi:hypothetical protein SAMN05660368_02641 [Marvinbryantia formatexigens]|nr:hypothetical protein SAMN05660368_02641 [Marvinbryantia formatexigens]
MPRWRNIWKITGLQLRMRCKKLNSYLLLYSVSLAENVFWISRKRRTWRTVFSHLVFQGEGNYNETCRYILI